MENESQVVSPDGVGGTPPPAPQAELTITDLQNLRSVVEVAVRRGAFAANELSSVGGVYDKVNAFLNAVAPAAAPDQTGKETN